MFRVIKGFHDLQDNHDGYFHEYKPGDSYPRDGAETTPERIAELSGPGNKRGSALIEEEIPAAPAPDPAVKKRTRKK